MSLPRLYQMGVLSVFTLICCAFIPTDQPETPPIMLDNIHYFVSDPKAAKEFFVKHFQAKPLARPDKNPLSFIDYLEVRPEQASIAISPRGPYQGMYMQEDPIRWKRTSVKVSAKTPPTYGVHWLALRTESIKYSLKSLEAQGVKVISTEVDIPGESSKAAMIWGPEYTRIVIIQRNREKSQETLYGIDHVMLLVENLEKNINFFKDVYNGEILKRNNLYCKMKVGDHILIMAVPEALNIPSSTVHRMDTMQFRPGIEQIGFLYKDPQPAYQSAAIKGYEFNLRPSRLIYRNKPTPYITAITHSPEGIYCEMYAEDGREGPRTVYINQPTETMSGNKKDK